MWISLGISTLATWEKMFSRVFKAEADFASDCIRRAVARGKEEKCERGPSSHEIVSRVTWSDGSVTKEPEQDQNKISNEPERDVRDDICIGPRCVRRSQWQITLLLRDRGCRPPRYCGRRRNLQPLHQLSQPIRQPLR